MSNSQAGRLLGDDRYSAWTPWRPIPAMVLTLAILLASVGLAAATASIWAFVFDSAGSGAEISQHIPESWPGSGKGDTGGEARTSKLGVMLLIQALIIVFTMAAASAGRGRAGDVLALRPAAGGARSYLLAFAGLLAGLAVFNIVANALNPDDWMRDLEQFQVLVRSDQWWIFALVVGIGAPLSEELLFRGFLLPALVRSPIGFLGGAIVTSAAWSALHWSYSYTSLIEVFAIGLYFCAVLRHTGSLWVTIVVHSAYNLTLLSFMGAFGGAS